jgi:hypothetical protein
MKTKTLLAAALTATLGYGTSANAVIIDLFDDPISNGVNTVTDSTVGGAVAFEEYPNLVDPPSTAAPSPSILGGYRDIIASLVAENNAGVPLATLEVGGGALSFSTSSGDTGIGIVQWDGPDNNADLDKTGLGGLDLINQTGCPVSGCDRFVAQVLVADNGFEYQIGFYTDDSNFSILTANTLFEVETPVIADYLFDWFLFDSGDYVEDGLPFNIQKTGTPDFTKAGALELVVNSDGGRVAVDLALDSITKTGIPEPGMLALMGIGLLAGGLAGRRRQAHKA